jgi:hypothetical protein
MAGEKAHPTNYRGYRHTKEELQKKKSQRTPKTATGRVFSSNLTTPGISFAAVLQGSIAHQQRHQARQVPAADQPAGVKSRVPAPVQQQESSQFSFQL